MRYFMCALVILVVASSGSAAAGDTVRPKQSPWRTAKRAEVAAKLDRGLARLCAQGSGGCAMRGLGRLIEQVGWREHVSPGVMVAASFTESSGGDAACSSNPKNAYGLSSCGAGWNVPYFQTWAESFTFYARYLKRQWPVAVDVYGLHGYSAHDLAWGNRTTYWASLLGFSNRLCYPCGAA